MCASVDLSYGYTTEAAETRGNAIKKRLAVEPGEAVTVRLIFDLYLKGMGDTGPMGVKRVAQWLNHHGYRNRSGSRWSIGKIHAILTNRTLIGTHEFGRTKKGR
jgi:site-specific DNA recombinase